MPALPLSVCESRFLLPVPSTMASAAAPSPDSPALDRAEAAAAAAASSQLIASPPSAAAIRSVEDEDVQMHSAPGAHSLAATVRVAARPDASDPAVWLAVLSTEVQRDGFGAVLRTQLSGEELLTFLPTVLTLCLCVPH